MENREIKFRGLQKNTNDWIYGNLFIPDKFVAGVYICPTCAYADFMPGFEDGDKLEDFRNSGSALGHFHQVTAESIGQFTGLTDKNGKEIYEGDIVKARGALVFSNPQVKKNELREIVRIQSGFTGVRIESDFDKKNPSSLHNWSNYTLWNVSHDLEIIGNIHEQ